MSLNISSEVEAHILAQAQQAGLSVEDYLENLVSQSEEFAAHLHRLESKSEPLSQEEVRAKLDRGLGQLKRGECADGELFIEDLLGGTDDARRTG